MPGEILYRGENYYFTRSEGANDALFDWDYEPVAFLCSALLNDQEVRKIFFTTFLSKNPPLLFLDPNKKFTPYHKFPNSDIFHPETMAIFTETDTPEKERLRVLLIKLIQKNYIKPDPMSLICCDCGYFSIGSGDTSKKKGFYCTKCGDPAYKGSKNSKVTQVFSFAPEVRDLINSRGRLLEGIIYHQCKKNVSSRFDIHSSVRMVVIKTGEDGKSSEFNKEKDILLIDKENKIKPIVILATLSSATEKEQVEDFKDTNLNLIYVSGRGVSEEATISKIGIKIIDRVIEEPNFPTKITSHIATLI